MKPYHKALALALSLGGTNAVNATSYSFLDPSFAYVPEGTTYLGSVSYSGLDSPITSAILTIFLSDDESSSFPGFVDIPTENAELAFVTGNASDVSPGLIAEVDGNSVLFSGLPVDDNGALSGPPPIATPPLGTVGSYFNFDVTSLLNPGITSGTVSFDLVAQDLIASFPPLLGGGPYIEDFNYEGAELAIETSAVPLPAAVWFMASGLIALFGFTGRKSVDPLS